MAMAFFGGLSLRTGSGATYSCGWLFFVDKMTSLRWGLSFLLFSESEVAFLSLAICSLPCNLVLNFSLLAL